MAAQPISLDAWRALWWSDAEIWGSDAVREVKCRDSAGVIRFSSGRPCASWIQLLRDKEWSQLKKGAIGGIAPLPDAYIGQQVMVFADGNWRGAYEIWEQTSPGHVLVGAPYTGITFVMEVAHLMRFLDDHIRSLDLPNAETEGTKVLYEELPWFCEDESATENVAKDASPPSS